MSAATAQIELPPGQQMVARGKWPLMGERAPKSSNAPWSLTIEGLVACPVTLSLAEIRARRQCNRIIDIHCVTRWSKLGVHFRGISLADLLSDAQPREQAKFVSFVARSEREHSTSLPLVDALDLDTFIAMEADDSPLPTEHGGPLRVVVPGRYFYKSLKWLERIELLDEDRLGYWESVAGYHNRADYWHEQRYLASGLSAAAAREILSTRDLRGRDLLGLYAAGMDLPALQASEALLRNADFRGCNLAGACFDGANLTNAHFDRAQLQGASFRGADLEGANFSGANLAGACLQGGSMVAASFVNEHGELGATFDASTTFSADRLDDLTPRQQAYLARHLLRQKD